MKRKSLLYIGITAFAPVAVKASSESTKSACFVTFIAGQSEVLYHDIQRVLTV